MHEACDVFKLKTRAKSFALNLMDEEQMTFTSAASNAELWHKRQGHFHYAGVLFIQISGEKFLYVFLFYFYSFKWHIISTPFLFCSFLFNFYPFIQIFVCLKAHYNETDILIDSVWNINHSFIQNCCIKARKIQQKYTSITLSGPWLRQHMYLIIVNLNSHCIIRLRVAVQIYVDTLSKITFVRRKKLLLSFQTEFWLLPMEKQTHTTISLLLQQQIWAPKPAC